VQHVVHAYVVDPAARSYGEAAAAALGIEPERMLKTLLAEVAFPDGPARLVCAVVRSAVRSTSRRSPLPVGGRRGAMAGAGRGRALHRLRRRAASARWDSAPGCHRWSTRRRSCSTPSSSAPAGAGCRSELAPAELLRLTGAVLADLAR
jgi:Cys-tRNA(Pro)/Cys-tRNA(Cys) deacylase